MQAIKTLAVLLLGLQATAAVVQADYGSDTNDDNSGANPNHVQYKIRRGEVPCRGVSLGSWLVAENWMSWESPLWEGVPKSIAAKGEYAMMKFLGQEKGDAAFENHRATWITEQDIEEIAKAKLNTVRVPVGFWIMYDDPKFNHREVHYPKGSLGYLDKMVAWGEKYNVAVMLSLHAHPGSQNGFEHSAPYEFAESHWSDSEANVNTSLAFATYLGDRYKKSPAFLGMNLMNEPAKDTNPETVKQYFMDAYAAIRTFSDCVLAVSPMIDEQDSHQFSDFMRFPNYFNVWHELHKFYLWGAESHSETQVMDAVKAYRADRIEKWVGNWLFIGEWCMQTAPTAPFTNQTDFQAFGQAQMDVYNQAHSGWTFWSWRHSDETIKRTGWSLRKLLQDGDLVL